MKIKDGFMIREVAGHWIVIPLAERVVEFKAIMNLNESGMLLWKALEEDVQEEDLVQILKANFDVDSETALEDVSEFISLLKDKNLLQ